MHIDPSRQSAADNYSLLTNLVIPRPIAWVTSVSAGGVINLAPFSFFNAVGGDPLYVVISVGLRDDGSPKDTARNITSGSGFVIHLVTEELMGQMTISAADFPPEISELGPSGLKTIPSLRISAPRLEAAQVGLECELHQSVPLGGNTLFIGKVVMFHVADSLIDDKQHITGFAPVARLGSPSMYCRSTDRFPLPRISYAQWLKQHPG